MFDLTGLFNAGAADAYLFVPSAIALGALHGLEPGHSKTMMAAFIVAVRGTVTQAILLGVAATISHTAIVWIVALTGLYLGSQWRAESFEPYFQIASGALMLLVAAWMGWRYRGQTAEPLFAALADKPEAHRHAAHAHHDRDHPHDHLHDHEHEHEPPAERREHHHHRNFGHPRRNFSPRVARSKEASFKEALIATDPEIFADAHEREHAMEIERRFAGGQATTGQIVLFGLTGGLIPCPASITVLLLCLQVGKIGLGALLVLCFSIGLALTLVLVGVAAALGLRHAARRWSGFDALARRAPYVSVVIVALIGFYTAYLGFSALA